jgi:predicted RNase H-like HicB family nuclease
VRRQPFSRKISKMAREFTIVVERGEDGMLIGSATALPGCHTQGATLDQLLERMKEAIELCLDVAGDAEPEPSLELLGIHRVRV